ncbi:MAG: hypothetical protein AAF993_07235 [Pseudomonadota bacterium]
MTVMHGAITTVFLPYIAGVMFYHGHTKRGAWPLNPRACQFLQSTAWLSLIVSFFTACYLFGIAPGVFYQLFSAALWLLVSLLVATRWPRVHGYSGLMGLALAGLLLIL